MTHRSKTVVEKPRFELPALKLDFGNITDGTNIPPPLPSPKVSKPPRAPPPLDSKEIVANDISGASKANGIDTERRLPGSQSAPVLDAGDRPQSRGGFSLMGDRKSRRNSGWFGRFRGGDQQPSRRSSFIFRGSSNNLSAPKQTELPPPMIPELRELEKDEGSLGSDIFGNIK